MTFKFLSIFHDFPGKFTFPGFSMIFHDRGNPVKKRRKIFNLLPFEKIFAHKS